jgi:Flp pilus assembly protein TadB
VDRTLTRDPRRDDAAVAPLLDAVASALRSGASVRVGLEAAARDGPFASILRGALARADSGAGLRGALDALARRCPEGELRMALAAMSLALGMGAAHAATLDTVAQRARERVALAREVRAMSSSARASATVMVLAPIAFGLLVVTVDPGVLASAMATGPGRVCIPAGLVCEAAGAWWMRRLVRAPTRGRGAHAAVDDLPELVDLVAMAMGAGLVVRAALAAAGPYAPGVPGRALRVASARIDAGAPPAIALAAWPRLLGDDVRPLVATLLVAHHDGAPAGDSLDRILADLRHARRQRAAERVQRLPVLLLFPLVCCILPAFVLLTVLPLALGSLGQLRT